MQISARLKQKIVQTVQTSMQIEGYKPTHTVVIQQQAQALLEQYRGQLAVG